MPGLEMLKGKDWAIILLVMLQVGELVAAVISFTFPWTLWAVVAAVGALLGLMAWSLLVLGWLKLPAISIMFIGLGGALLTFLVRGPS